MRSTEAYARLEPFGPFLTTAEAGAALGEPGDAVVHTLRALESAGLAQRVFHGIWKVGTAAVDPRALAEVLTRPLPAYVSFDSALAAHGVIDEIPRRIALASSDRTRTLETALGTFEIHRLPPELIGGYATADGVALAGVEKALFDLCYVSAVSGRSQRVPELDLPDGFDPEALRRWTAAVPSARIRSMVTACAARALARTAYAAAFGGAGG